MSRGAVRWRGLTLAMLVGAASLALAGFAQASGRTGLAARLVARHPGRRVAGNTLVSAVAGQRVYGDPRRANFIMALGAREKVVSGGVGDQLGATGAGARIDSRGGHSLIVDRGKDGWVRVRGTGNTIVVTGHDDRVVCAQGSRRDVLYLGPDDTAGRTCRAQRNVIRPAARRRSLRVRAGVTPAADTGSVTGTGTDADPFVAPCDQHAIVCTVTFPARTLSGLWANEFVPSYKCPTSHPFLVYRNVNKTYGTTVPDGVAIKGLGPIGVSITKTIAGTADTTTLKASGFAAQTATGYPNSSATNWTFGSNSYQVVLHCNLRDFYPAGAVHPSPPSGRR
jgi:hypothetical protein